MSADAPSLTWLAMTQDQTMTNPPQSDHSPAAGAEPGGPLAAVLRAADGAHVPVPPGLPAMAEAHAVAVNLADALLGPLGRADLAAAAAFEEVARAALGSAEFAPGGALYPASAKVAALAAFRRVLVSAQAQIDAARARASEHGDARAEARESARESAGDGGGAAGGE